MNVAARIAALAKPGDEGDSAQAWLLENLDDAYPAIAACARTSDDDVTLTRIVKLLEEHAAYEDEGEAADVPLLVRILRTPTSEASAAAALALARHPEEGAEAALFDALEDGDKETAILAAFALGEHGSDDARPHLERLLRHPDPDVRVAAVDALSQRGADDSHDVLAALVKSEKDERVRLAISNAIAIDE